MHIDNMPMENSTRGILGLYCLLTMQVHIASAEVPRSLVVQKSVCPKYKVTTTISDESGIVCEHTKISRFTQSCFVSRFKKVLLLEHHVWILLPKSMADYFDETDSASTNDDTVLIDRYSSLIVSEPSRSQVSFYCMSLKGLMITLTRVALVTID